MIAALMIVAGATFADAARIQDTFAGHELYWPGASPDAGVPFRYVRLAFAEKGNGIAYDLGMCVFGKNEALESIDCVRRIGTYELTPGPDHSSRVKATFTRAWEVKGKELKPLPAERSEVTFKVRVDRGMFLITHDGEAMRYGDHVWEPGDRGGHMVVKRALSPDAVDTPMLTGPGEWRTDVSREFGYTLPDRWKVVPLPAGSPGHDIILVPGGAGANRNIVITDQLGKDSLAELKRKYERDLPRALRDFRLLRSELVTLEGGREAIRIIHTNTTPGDAVRQINYILEVGGKRYFIACTVRVEDGETYDKPFETFIRSMVKPDEAR